MWLKVILDHLKGHPLEYVMLLLIMFGVGWQGSSIADEWMAKRIATEVRREIAPTQAQMVSLAVDVKGIKSGLDNLIVSSLKRSIIEVKTLLCYSPGDQRLVQQFEEMQGDYEGLVGRRYEAPGCDVLKRPG